MKIPGYFSRCFIKSLGTRWENVKRIIAQSNGSIVE